MLRLVEIYSLDEDSRGNIEKLLGWSKQMADKFHKFDQKHSFFLAAAARAWAGDTSERGGEVFLYGDDWNEPPAPALLQFIKKNPSKKKQFQNTFLKDTPENAVKLIDMTKSTYDENEDVEEIMKTSDGYRWVNLKTACSNKEGEMMKHCGSSQWGFLLSLRDRNNKPHVTLTLSPNQDSVGTAVGRASSSVQEKYWKHIQELIDHLGVPYTYYTPDSRWDNNAGQTSTDDYIGMKKKYGSEVQ